MTETEIKLRDAKIQLDLAMSRDNIGKIEVVRSCINAFIAEMKFNPLLNFFNKQRATSIHHRSVQPLQRTINIAKVEQDGKTIGVGGIALIYEFDDFDKVIPGDNGNVFRHCLIYYEYLDDLVKEWKEIVK